MFLLQLKNLMYTEEQERKENFYPLATILRTIQLHIKIKD
jgi:hypothetical protein